jgi:hypothetical protein
MARPLDVQTLANEVAESNFSDERLTNRLRLLVAALASDPRRSLPSALDSAGLEAAYRFFSNPRVTPEGILSSHVEATRARCAEAPEFLIVHDSTDFSYRFDGERQGLGRAQLKNPKSKQMFFAHASLAVAADGTRRPLGVAALKTWVRGEERRGVEHLRWEEQVHVAAGRLGNLPNAIHVMDREADDYALFAAFAKGNHRFIVRSYVNRVLDQSPKVKLHDVLAVQRAVIERPAKLSRRKRHRVQIHDKIHPERDARVANLCISAMKVALKRPRSREADATDGQLPPSLDVNVVRVWEPDPPAGEEPIEWMLYTSDPIDTPEQLLTIVDRYRARWIIEEYFKAIKTGCEFEKRQLQDYEALVNLLATFAPIAYRLLLIRSESRRSPEADALTVLTQDELDVLKAKGRIRLGASPTVREVYRAVAALGGYIKYSATEPGWLTLARGFETLSTLTEGWVAAKLQLRSDQR